MSATPELVTALEWRAARRSEGVLGEPVHLCWTLPGTAFAPSLEVIAHRTGLEPGDLLLEAWELATPVGSTPIVLAEVHEEMQRGRPVSALTIEGRYADGGRFRRAAGFSAEHVTYMTSRWPPQVQLRVVRLHEGLRYRDVREMVRVLTILEVSRRKGAARTAPSWT